MGVSSSGCVAPAWHAWWLVSKDSNISKTIRLARKETKRGDVTLTYSTPLGVPAGSYNLRLVISASQEASWQQADANTFHFDTADFVVDVKPQGGACTVAPVKGEQMVTEFTLSSSGWIEEDLPLQYEYSWRTAASKDSTSWTLVRAMNNKVDAKTVLGTLGNLTMRARVADSLGSTGEVTTAVTVERPQVTLDEASLVGIVGNIAKSGDSTATLSAIS